MSISRKLFLLLFSFLLAATAQTRGAMDIFLNLEKIPGESLDANHKDWIDVLSFSHMVSRGLGPVRPVHSGLTVTKRLDKASPRLSFSCNRGTVIPNATIEFVRLVEEQFRFYKIQLTNAVIVSVQNSGSSFGDDSMYEYVTLEYDAIQWSYTPQNFDGTPDEDIVTWWDIPAKKGGTVVPNPDNDGDGTPDSSDPDDDNDGITDVYEIANGLNPFVYDANSDLDHDGASNYNEFIAGTAANDVNSVLRVVRTSNTAGQAQITWSSVTGKTYEVHSSSAPNGPYSFLATVPSSGTSETSVQIPASDTNRYFRIRVLP